LSVYKDKMLALRKTQPQGGEIAGRSKAVQQKDASPEFLSRIESSVAYGESDADTGITESPGDLGEIAYPQSDRMDAEEALFAKLSKTTGGKGSETKSSTAVGKAPSKASATTIKHKRSNYAPHKGKEKRGPHGPTPPKLDTLDDYEGKQTDEYFSIAQNVMPPKNYDDLTQNYAAQTSFGQSAAMQSLNQKRDKAEPFKQQTRTLPGGETIPLIVFGDGSEYYVDPDADINKLYPGDVIRIEPPKDKR